MQALRKIGADLQRWSRSVSSSKIPANRTRLKTPGGWRTQAHCCLSVGMYSRRCATEARKDTQHAAKLGCVFALLGFLIALSAIGRAAGRVARSRREERSASDRVLRPLGSAPAHRSGWL